MEYVRMAILDKRNSVIGYLDNSQYNSLHYYDEMLHTFLEGSASLFEFTVPSHRKTSRLIQVGNKISFVYNTTNYYFNILGTEENEREIKATCYASCFELLNEQAIEYESTTGKHITEYLDMFITTPGAFEVGINEVESRTRTAKWTGNSDTILNRIYSLANIFEAEIEFVPILNDNYTLKKTILNIYKKHSSSNQGLGQNRQDVSLRYGVDVDTITRSIDISELYTQIKPIGKDDNNNPIYIHDWSYDNVIDGQHYVSKAGLDTIENETMWDRFPSTIKTGYIRYIWNTDYKTVNDLAGHALQKLQEISQPKVEYKVEGFYDLKIGDVVTIHDEAFETPLNLKARVVEQKICFTDPIKNETVFDNYTEEVAQTQ